MKITPNIPFLATSSGKIDSEPQQLIMSQQIALSVSSSISATFCPSSTEANFIQLSIFMAGHAPEIVIVQPKVPLSPLGKGSVVLLEQPVCVQPVVGI